MEGFDPYHDLEEEVEEMEEVQVEAMEEVQVEAMEEVQVEAMEEEEVEVMEEEEVEVMEEVEVEVEAQVEEQGELHLSQIFFLSWVLLGKQVMQPLDPASAEVNGSEVMVELFPFSNLKLLDEQALQPIAAVYAGANEDTTK